MRDYTIHAKSLTRANGEVRPAFIISEGNWYYLDPLDWSPHDTQYSLIYFCVIS